MVRRLLYLLAAAVASASVAGTAPTAHAEVPLQVGMTVQDGGEVCTVGFFGADAAGHEFIVTAGHCSRSVGEIVYNRAGSMIGQVVAREPDAQTALGPFGYTLIWLAQGTYIGADFFHATGAAGVGDTVHVYGARTGLTGGSVTATADGADPAAVLESSARVARGDSGGPWYEDGPTLVGICIGYDVAVPSGAFLFSYAMPIGPLLELIQRTAGDWGNSLRVLTD